MGTPVTVELPVHLAEIRERWLQASREEQDLIYARDFAPEFIPLFRDLPLHGWPGERPQPRFLASVLGLSWQPVALMTAWFAPRRLLLLGTSESLSHRVNGKPVVELICRLSDISPDSVEVREITEPEELGIYREVSRFTAYHGIGPRDLAIDPTGGKKSMSASAALAGYLTGAWLVYVDYLEYCPKRRIPLPGSEYPRLLHNPLEVFGELEFQKIREAFDRGSFDEARHLAEQLSDRLYEKRQAEVWALLSRAFGLWHRFDFMAAAREMETAVDLLKQFGPLAPWPWARDFLDEMAPNREALQVLARLAEQHQKNQKPGSLEEGLPLVLNHLAAAERASTYKQWGIAILLIYATLERFIDLCLWVEFGLDDENPDFSHVTVDLERFHKMGRVFHGKQYREQTLTGPLGLSLGAQLLATLKPDFLSGEYLPKIKGLMSVRNKCEYEHGLCPRTPSVEDVAKYLNVVKEILAKALHLSPDKLEELLQPYRFPSLRSFGTGAKT